MLRSAMRFGFGIVATEDAGAPAMADLREAVQRVSPVELEPQFFEGYDPLARALDSGACAFAWTPPFVAHQLARTGAAQPVAAIGRKAGTSYYTALVTPEGSAIATVDDLAGARVGWVSRISAAGYVFARLHLRSLGVDTKATTRRSRIFSSAERSTWPRPSPTSIPRRAPWCPRRSASPSAW
jgi:ABC-type phosphate/phosphonate transport system substrate-binding protein